MALLALVAAFTMSMGSALAWQTTVNIGSWSGSYTYAPNSGQMALDSAVNDSTLARYIKARAYNFAYNSQQVQNMRDTFVSNVYWVTHAFHNNPCSAGQDRGSWMEGTTYTSSTLPGAHFDQRKQASCDGSGSPYNEVRVWFDRNQVQANTSYAVTIEYRDVVWNNSNWNSQGTGNGDNGKLGFDQYTVKWAGETKEIQKYGFFCSFINRYNAAYPGASSSQCP
jgi:hypothetical protein